MIQEAVTLGEHLLVVERINIVMGLEMLDSWVSLFWGIRNKLQSPVLHLVGLYLTSLLYIFVDPLISCIRQ